MPKICHMTSAHSARDVRIFHKMCVSLAHAGYDTYLVAPGESFTEKGVQVVGAGDKPVSRLKRMTGMAKKVYQKALEIDADIYHFHDPELLPYGLKLKRKGKIAIFDSHEDCVAQIAEKTWIPSLIRIPLKWIFEQYQKHICKNISGVISVSPHICKRFEDMNVPVAMICNFPDVPSQYLPPKLDGKTLVFAGGISKQWSHSLILDAMERVPNARYVLCGKGHDGYLEPLTHKPAWSRVDYRGMIPFAAVPAALAEGHAGMSVLQYSGNMGGKTGTLGNTKIFEYMLAGLPIVCTDFTLWQEIMDEYHFGICVDPTNTEEIAAAVRYLMDNPAEARQMGENGRKAVLEKYNWNAEEAKLLSLYQSLCE